MKVDHWKVGRIEINTEGHLTAHFGGMYFGTLEQVRPYAVELATAPDRADGPWPSNLIAHNQTTGETVYIHVRPSQYEAVIFTG